MIKKWPISCLLIFILVLPFENQAQDTKTLLKEAQQFEASFKDNEALQKYLQLVKLESNNLVALCKTSELYAKLGKRQPTKPKQSEYYVSAKQYAEKALKVNENSSEANFVMAMAMGRMALMNSGKEKIKVVKEIRHYAERCIQLDPNNFKGYHILAKWHYEVSDLNAIERWLVKITYGGLPPSSLEDAIRNYEKSKQLNPVFILNYLELAKAYHRNDEDKKAIAYLQAMLKLPSTQADDNSVKEEGRKLLKDLTD